MIKLVVRVTLTDCLDKACCMSITPLQRLSSTGYMAICKGMKRNTTLQRLSFSGSKMGDAKVRAQSAGLRTASCAVWSVMSFGLSRRACKGTCHALRRLSPMHMPHRVPCHMSGVTIQPSSRKGLLHKTAAVRACCRTAAQACVPCRAVPCSAWT